MTFVLKQMQELIGHATKNSRVCVPLFHMSFDSCLVHSGVRLFTPVCRKRYCHVRIFRSTHHHRVRLITRTKPAPQTPPNFFSRRINNSSPLCSTDHTNETSPPPIVSSVVTSTTHQQIISAIIIIIIIISIIAYITLTSMCTGSEK